MDLIKADGEKEAFDEVKFRGSLERAGAAHGLIDKITLQIKPRLKAGMTTSDLYRLAFEMLKKYERPIASRYSLRRALLSFGPSGFPFEKFLADLYAEHGYIAMTDQVIRGHCIDHELDVIAYNDKKLIMIEAKFHNEPGTKTDAKVALYIKARKDDLMGAEFNYGRKRKIDDFLLITNTKFSTSAIQYAKCAGLTIIGWNYPSKGNLQDMVESTGLHPITCLTNLSKSDKDTLLGNGFVLCRDVAGKPEVLSALGFSEITIAKILSEAEFLCRSERKISLEQPL